MTPVRQATLSEAETALVAALGADAVITAAADLGEYTADPYWPAVAAKAAGAPIARPDVIDRPRTEEDVATVLAPCDAHRVRHGAGLDSIRRIKEALDPHHVMNPGKLGL